MGMQAQDLSVARGGMTVLAGLSFALPLGEALILRGPNGVGKTTLLRTLAGLQPPVAGQVKADPDDLIYASHADGLKSMLSVRENLTFWAQIFGHRAIDAAVDHFDLGPLIDRPAGLLSAGQKRRLGLARLLVSGRKIWLLDEPTVSLDQAATARFAETVQTHLAHGGAALMATHIDLGLTAKTLDVTANRDAARALIEAEERYL